MTVVCSRRRRCATIAIVPISYVDAAQRRRVRSWLAATRGDVVRLQFGDCDPSDLDTEHHHVEVVTRLGGIHPPSADPDELTLTLPDLPSSFVRIWPRRAVLLNLRGGRFGLRIVYDDGTTISISKVARPSA